MNRLMTLALVILAIAGAVPAAARPVPPAATGENDKCFSCHATIGGKEADAFKHDVHFAKGISCAGCHGGNQHAEEMEQGMDSAAGFRGVPKGDDISRTCASCHADSATMRSFGSSLPTNQWELLQSSVHAKLALNGKEHIVQCITCHGAHGIVHVKDPAAPVAPLNVVATCTKCHADAAYMRDYNPALPVDQRDKYRTSVHGMLNAKGDPKPAECASCHGSHGIRQANDLKSSVYAVNIPATCAKCHADAAYMKQYGIPTDQYAKFSKSVHGLALLVRHDVGAPACNDCHGNHGATPPGVESVSKVCGTCHALNADLFSASPHKKAFDDRKLPECETCHGKHDIAAATDSLVGTTAPAVCARCHSATESPRGFAAARTMRSLMDSLAEGQTLAAKLLDDAEQKGMEVSESKFRLRDAHQARLQSRTAIHAFNEKQFRDVVGKGLTVTAAAAAEGRQAIDEYYFRRWGLGVATLIISIVGISLWFTIRGIERRQRSHQQPTQKHS